MKNLQSFTLEEMGTFRRIKQTILYRAESNYIKSLRESCIILFLETVAQKTTSSCEKI